MEPETWTAGRQHEDTAHRKKDCVKMETQVDKSRNAKNYWLHETLEETGRILPLRLGREHEPTDTWILYF